MLQFHPGHRLPPGYSWGEPWHDSKNEHSGRYIIRDADKKKIKAMYSLFPPDFDVSFDEAFDRASLDIGSY